MRGMTRGQRGATATLRAANNSMGPRGIGGTGRGGSTSGR